MSTASKDISYAVVDAIYDALGGDTGFVSGGNTYPIYKTIPKEPAKIYIRIGEVLEAEDGTKDDFVYKGSVPVIICDESQTKQADKKKAYNILNQMRATLKPTKASTLTGLVIFSHEGKTEYIDLNDEAKPKIRIVDIYNFLIE